MSSTPSVVTKSYLPLTGTSPLEVNGQLQTQRQEKDVPRTDCEQRAESHPGLLGSLRRMLGPPEEEQWVIVIRIREGIRSAWPEQDAVRGSRLQWSMEGRSDQVRKSLFG